MDPRLLAYYEKELLHLRDMAAEFARANPGPARRLGMEGLKCADPYVERLLEGFSFLSARIQLKLDAEFPRFTQHLLEMVYPQYLAPTPSMAVVQFKPDLREGALSEGFTIERGSALRTSLARGERTACEYRTAHDVTMWPIELQDVEYITHALDVPGVAEIKSALRIRLRATAGLKFDAIKLDRLVLYFHGTDDIPFRLFEQTMGHGLGVLVQPVASPPAWREVLPAESVRRIGFEDDEALLPSTPRAFQGYRLLHEYFTFPQRFCFVEISGLARAISRCADDQLELILLFDRLDPRLEHTVGPSHVSLNCTPAINLFERDADRIHLTEHDTEYQVVPDRTRPMDLEVYQITRVLGHGTAVEEDQEFLPFYASKDVTRYAENRSYYVVNRLPRLLSQKQRREGTRAGYVGHDVFLGIVDGNAAPFPSSLRQLEVSTQCTNRDLPLMLAFGPGSTDFTLKTGAPVESIRCVSGPTWPIASHPGGEIAWRLVNHLSLNYLSLVNADEQRGAEALRSLLGLYAKLVREEIAQQVEGIRSVSATTVTRRLPVPGPLTFGRGLEIELTMDEGAFEGIGVFMLGTVLEAFFSKYVSINSFTETVIKTVNRGEIARWPARLGRRPTL